MYRGYYIDNIIFNTKADIDTFVRQQAIEAYERACKRFAEQPSVELSVYCAEQAEHLNKVEGMSWEEIEEIEIRSIA